MDITKIAEHDGSADIDKLMSVSNDIIACIKKLRSLLGDKNKLLDKFIFGVLSALNQTAASDFTSGTFDNINGELRRLCTDIRGGMEHPEHPFYKTLKAYIDANPCPVSDIYVDYYCAAVSLDYAKFALDGYIEQRRESTAAVLEEERIAELATELERFIPPSALEELCGLIYKRLIIIPSANVFLQSIADQFILSCLLEDKPSSRYVFQYLLDAACDE